MEKSKAKQISELKEVLQVTEGPTKVEVGVEVIWLRTPFEPLDAICSGKGYQRFVVHADPDEPNVVCIYPEPEIRVPFMLDESGAFATNGLYGTILTPVQLGKDFREWADHCHLLSLLEEVRDQGGIPLPALDTFLVSHALTLPSRQAVEEVALANWPYPAGRDIRTEKWSAHVAKSAEFLVSRRAPTSSLKSKKKYEN